jgi:hypothetical protein
MNTHSICRGVMGAAGLAFAALCIVLFAAPMAAFGFVGAAVLPVVGTGATGTSIVGDAGSRIIPDIDQIIDEYDPALTPALTLIDRLGELRMDVGAVEFSTLERSPFQRYAQVNGAHVAGGAGAARVVTVDAGHMIVPGDIVKLFVAAYNTTDGDVSWDYIVTATTSTTITVKQLPEVTTNTRGTYATAVAFGTVPALADNAILQWIGNAKSEADAASRPRRLEPAELIQYIQTFDMTAALSDHAQRLDVYGTPDLWADALRQMVGEYHKSRNLALLMQGEKSTTSDTNLNGEVQKTWKFRGLRASLANTISVPTAATIADLVTFTYSANTGYEGYAEKILFAGSGLLSKFDLAAAGSTLYTTQSETVFGVEMTTVKGRKGSVNLVWEPAFDEMEIPNEGYLLHMGYIGRATMQAPEQRGNDNSQKEYGAMVDRVMRQIISKEAPVVHKATGDRAVHRRVVLV